MTLYTLFTKFQGTFRFPETESPLPLLAGNKKTEGRKKNSKRKPHR